MKQILLLKIISFFLFNFNIFSDEDDIDNEFKKKLNNLGYKYIYLDNLKKHQIIDTEKYSCDNVSEDLIIIKFKIYNTIDSKGKVSQQFIYKSSDSNVNATIYKKNDGKYYFYFKDNKNSDDLQRIKGKKKEIDEIELNKIGYFFKLTNYKNDSNEIETEEYLFTNNLDIFNCNKKLYMYFFDFFYDSIKIIENKEEINDFLFLNNINIKNFEMNKQIKTINFNSYKGIFNNLKKFDLSNLTIINPQNFKDYFNKNNQVHIFEEIKLPKMTITDLEGCFLKCKDLKNVNLSKIETEQPISLKECFKDCENLEEIIFPEIKVSNLESCFYKCKNLKKVDLSKIKTDQPISLACCFFGCENLEEVIFPDNLKTINFSNIFSYCEKIKNIDLKNTQFYPDHDDKCYKFINTFLHCSSLENVDLSRIIFTDKNIKKYWLISMFNKCNNLNTVNMKSFNLYYNSLIIFFNSKIKNLILNNLPNDKIVSILNECDIENLQLENITFEEFKKTCTYKENYKKIKNLYINGEKIDDDERERANNEIEEERKNNSTPKDSLNQNLNEKSDQNSYLSCCGKCFSNCCCCCPNNNKNLLGKKRNRE